MVFTVGEFFIFKADNQTVVMRIPKGGDDVILETCRLYKSIHDFMQLYAARSG
jgi:hypothetical protein